MPFSDLARGLDALAAQAGRLAQQERDRLVKELKPDGSIVTNGDRAVETFLRERLPSLLPHATVWGEEFGFEEEGPEGQWLIDPVDGTTNYAFGSPLWGVSIALKRGDEIVLGAIDLPDLGERFLAEKGQGATLNDRPLPLIPAGPVRPEEPVSYGDGISRRYHGRPLPGKMRLSGAFVVDGAFTATQRVRGLIGNSERLYDVAAVVLIARELDADVRFIDGDPFDMEKFALRTGIAKPWIAFPRDSGFVLA